MTDATQRWDDDRYKVFELQLENQALKQQVVAPVIWREDAVGVWMCKGCREEWTFEWGGPAENSVRYCQGCGGRITEFVHYVEPPIEEDADDA